MKKLLKESEHLVRLALVLGAGVLVFLLIRRVVVPPSFGKLGHYRAASIDTVMARPITFAGHGTCEACHDEIFQTKNQGKHAKVACEACHEGSARHTEDPTTNKAIKPDVATLCVRCHEADPARPKWFPQVVSKDHSQGLVCNTCHNPHRPKE
jgi:predicted CXXCH cytochrome family protein